MSDENTIINHIRSYSSGVTGRSIANVRNHHLVIDEPTLSEAITPAETFLSGVSACAVGLIEMVAARRDVPLENIEVTIDGYRDKANPSYFQRVEMRFDLRGVDEDQAQKLVAAYQGY